MDLAGTVGALFYQRLVKLSSCPGVDIGPAELAVVLEAGDISTKKGSELPSAACTLTLITQLVIQDVGLHFHLGTVWTQTLEAHGNANGSLGLKGIDQTFCSSFQHKVIKMYL